jgi:NAD(P)-dependent dehydrogenase (short-subunit alcohol dehydrogenase family)
VDKEKFAAGMMMKRLSATVEVAKVIVFLLSDDASYITEGKLTSY